MDDKVLGLAEDPSGNLRRKPAEGQGAGLAEANFEGHFEDEELSV